MTTPPIKNWDVDILYEGGWRLKGMTMARTATEAYENANSALIRMPLEHVVRGKYTTTDQEVVNTKSPGYVAAMPYLTGFFSGMIAGALIMALYYVMCLAPTT